MNSNLLILSVIHLIISVFVGVIVLYMAFYFTSWFFKRKKFQIEKNNLAFGIFASSIMLSVGIIVSSAYSPSMSLLQLLQKSAESKMALFINFSLYFLLFLAISVIISFVIIVVSAKLYTVLTSKIDEYLEISQNNVSVALITGITIIVIALFAKDSVSMIIESLLPYPKIGIIN